MKVLGIIPARYSSTRFPGKPLIDIKGKSMIQRVYEQATKAESLAHVVVATDDERIFEHVKNFGGDVMMTSPEHQSGTDRCAEVATMMNLDLMTQVSENAKSFAFDAKRERPFDAVVNIQGDEPFIDPQQINKVVEILRGGIFSIATLSKVLDNQEDIRELTKPEGIEVIWICGDINKTAELISTFKSWKIPSSDAAFWIAGEDQIIRDLRRYIRREKEFGRDDIYAIPYWRHGYDEEGYHHQRHEVMDNPDD